MLKDQYDNELSTRLPAARDAYVKGLDLILAGQAGVIDAFTKAIKADDSFAMGWIALGRAQQYADDMVAARASAVNAQERSGGVTAREASHINAFSLLLTGQVPDAYKAIRAHMQEWPRDALLAQTCSSVFGLIGFSGQPGREAETLAFVAGLMPHYGKDWWITSQYAFALGETGNLAKADVVIDESLALNPTSAHSAHVRSHVTYEMGETDAGRAYLRDYMADYDRAGVLYCHLNWHEALWALEQGDLELMWAKVDNAVAPEAKSSSPAINVVTDTAAILHRATMAGVAVSQERWKSVSDYALAKFPKPGMGFVDVHAALAHAMAGREEALDQLIDAPAGPIADLVPEFGRGFRAVANEDWASAERHLLRAMGGLERIGGSRAQRDMVEQTLLMALVKQGKKDEARAIATLRRPLLSASLAA